MEEYVRREPGTKDYEVPTSKGQTEGNKTSREAKGNGQRDGERTGVDYNTHREIKLHEDRKEPTGFGNE